MMKMFILVLTLIAGTSAMAADKITGKITLNGKKIAVAIDNNINTGKYVSLDSDLYRIFSHNETLIQADNMNNELLAVYKGDGLTEGVLTMTKSEIASYFELTNDNEIKCKTGAKAFLVVMKNTGFIGNCVY